ncbi:MAG: TIGR03986 family CRISPR-associated RAMP protein [Thermaerobacter sp.]|nr:TIGR03986 family CRISPR-associated RAMP protein [Thermaerobacter sp.]
MKGKLLPNNKKNGWMLRDDRGITFQIRRGSLAPDLEALRPNGKGVQPVEVEFELKQGQPTNIRRPGTHWVVPSPESRGALGNTQAGVSDRFHNPYNFVPAPPRHLVGDLADSRPPGHQRYHGDRWYGRLQVQMEVVTPLLLPDAAKAKQEAQGHQVFPVRLVNGQPYVPPTAVKGMLRSAYEIITNSRLGVFKDHDRPLGYRMGARQGLEMVPARINGNTIELLPGTSEIQGDGRPKDNRMYAAWLPRYQRGRPGISGNAVKINGRDPRHGEQCYALLQLVQHLGPNFRLWRVMALAAKESELPTITEARKKFPRITEGKYQYIDEYTTANGYICITNQNISTKHDERFLFANNSAYSVPLTDDIRNKWRNLILNYRDAHRYEDIWERKNKAGKRVEPQEYIDKEPGKTAWALHQYEKDYEKLDNGTLCYARVRRNGNRLEVLGLYPVMIARELFEVAPDDLLPENLRPACAMEELSPADRVFGWVAQGKAAEQAWRGCLRVGVVRCETPDPVQGFGDEGLALAILGEPKPQQARFYVARNQNGEPQNDGILKEQAGYGKGKGLRGRKVYPHHAGLPDGYWDPQSGGRGEKSYCRPNNVRDSQNRSVLGWVRPGTSFSFHLDFEHLSEVELGALIFLLQLSSKYHHRLGGGKPLGFGSVRLSLRTASVYKGKELQRALEALEEPRQSALEDLSACSKTYREALERAYGQPFEQVAFIQAFLKAAEGYKVPQGRNVPWPIRYPKVWDEGSLLEEGYKWFVENEREVQGHQKALPKLADDRGLPVYQQQKVGGGGPYRGGR